MRRMGLLIGIFGSAHDLLLRWVNKRIPALTTIPYAILISRDAKARGSEIYGLPRPAVGIEHVSEGGVKLFVLQLAGVRR